LTKKELVLIPDAKNAKKAPTIIDLMGRGNLSYKRITLEEYFELTKINNN